MLTSEHTTNKQTLQVNCNQPPHHREYTILGGLLSGIDAKSYQMCRPLLSAEKAIAITLTSELEEMPLV